MFTRRRFLKIPVAAAASGMGIGLYAWQIEPHWLEIVKRPLAIAGLPESLSGARLVQLSDLHVGLRVADSYILETFERVAALKPDIVAFTGDFITYHRNVFAHAKRIYARVPHGRLATVGILGNHEYGPNWSQPRVADRMTEILQSAGIRILRNTVTQVAGLQVVGFDDLWAGQFRPARALAMVNPTAPVLAMSHNPDTVDLPVWQRFQGWILSGHTHGGQCKPPFLPPPILPVKNRRYSAGEFELSGNRRMYISRGVGHMWQVRFNVRPEATVFVLEAAPGPPPLST
jgi:predicted MPP superfamily phosphohydrolase